MQDFWDINKIKQILPKDCVFFFIDRVVEIDQEAKRIRCLKNITVNEHFFSSHFPAKPIMPGAIFVEAAQQAAIILYAILRPDKRASCDYSLEKIEANFFSKIKAGDQLVLEAEADKLSDKQLVVKGVASVNDEKSAQGTVFLKLNKEE